MSHTIFKVLTIFLTVQYAGAAAATDYTFTSGGGLSPNPAGFPGTPLSIFGSTSSLNVQSGTMAATAGNFTVATGTDSVGLTATVQAGATVSYAGANTSANTMVFDCDSRSSYFFTLTNFGTISTGTAINGNALLLDGGDDTGGGRDSIFHNNFVVNGPISWSGPKILNFNTTSCQVNGAMTFITNDPDETSQINLGNTSAVNYTTGGTISNAKNIRLFSGTFIANHAISSLDASFTVDSSTTARLNAAVTGAAATTNNGTMFIGPVGSLGTTGIFTNNNQLNIASAFVKSTYASFVNTTGELYMIGSGSYTGTITEGTILAIGQDSNGDANSCNFTTGGAISGVEVINVYNGSLTANHPISGVTNSFYVFSGATATLNNTLSGSNGDTTIDGNLVYGLNNAVNTSGGGSNHFVTNSTGKVYLPFQFTPANFSTFTNAGEFYIYGAGSIVGAFNPNPSGGSLNFGKDLANTSRHADIYSLTVPVTNTPTVHFYDGTFTSSAGGTFTGVSTAVTVDAPATVTFGATCSGMGPLANFGNTTIAAAYGSGVITNKANANLYLASGASSISSIITNDLDGDLYVNSAAKVTAGVNNNGNMYLAANLDMTGQTLNSTKTVTVTGNRTLTAANYTNTGTHITTLTSQSTYDSLTCTGCAINITNLDLSSSILTGAINTPVVVLSGTSITLVNPPIFPATASFLQQFTYVNTGTQLRVSATRVGYVDLANGSANYSLAGALDGFAGGTMNPEQTTLISAINASANASVLNDAFRKLLPSINTTERNIGALNDGLSKAETRLAALRNDESVAYKTGFNAGDIGINSSMWIAPMGSISYQKAKGDNFGYKAKSIGFITGLDAKPDCANLVGVGFAMTGTRLTDFSNRNATTNTHRYHGLLYGTRVFDDNYYLDWLLTASYNKNKGQRLLNINGTNFNNRSQYDSYNFAFKVVQSKSFDFWESYRFSPLTSIQYGYAHQKPYNETGGSAFHIQAQKKNIVTLGVGSKLNFPIDAWRMIGMRELRAIVTYDVLSAKNVTKANFIFGSNTFSLIDPPTKLALKLGAGLTFEVAKQLQLQFAYDFEMRNKFTDHTGLIKVKYVF